MLIYLGHVESLNWGNVFKNRWDLCSHNLGDPFRVGEGGGGFFHCLEKSFKVRGIVEAGPLGNLKPRGFVDVPAETTHLASGVVDSGMC